MPAASLRASFPEWQVMLQAAVVFLAVLIASEVSIGLSAFPAIFPLHSGVALAALVLAGIRFWPAIFAATITVYWWHDAPLVLALAYALGNSIQAVTGATFLKYVSFKASLRRMRDILWLTIVALLVSTIVPVVGFVGFEINQSLGGSPVPVSIGAAWVGHIFSLLILAPFLIRWLAHPIFDRTWREVVEIIAAMTALSAIYAFLFFTTIEQINGIPLVYLIFPPLFWIALRLGSRFMTLGLFATSMLALIGTSLGYASAQTAVPTGQLLFLTQIFLEVIAVIFLLVTAVEEERRTATARLQAHIDQLQEALTKIRSEDSAKTQFVATLAHELRNPLAPLLSTIELLTLRGPNAKDFPVMLSTMRDRVRTMARLLDDLLDISRITHQKLKLQKTTVDIVGIVKSSVESMSGYMQKRNLAFNVTLPHSETLLLEADPIRLEQIVVNLLHNAAKYTDTGGTIHLIVERDRNMAAIRVRDTGIGIPPTMLQKIFEPFLQVNAKQTSGGLGIGLSLTKRLVELHDGSIEAKSRGEGHGSEFIVRLPLLTVSPIQPAQPRPQHAVRVENAPTGLRILLVDDNQAAVETLGKLLEFKGYSVRFAHDGRSTVQAAEEFDPHVIMLDIGLPDMNGYDVARRLRQERGHDFALVAITGYGQEDDKSRAKSAGFDHHLTKPVAISDLEKTLALLVEARPALRTP